MNKKRYSIVRVEGKCGKNLEYYECDYDCCDCLYGDTKEQLIKKVAQALIIDEIERYRKAPNCDVNKTIVKHISRICLEKAKQIVEFLGVEE